MIDKYTLGTSMADITELVRAGAITDRGRLMSALCDAACSSVDSREVSQRRQREDLISVLHASYEPVRTFHSMYVVELLDEEAGR